MPTDRPGPSFVDVDRIYPRRGELQQVRLSRSVTFECLRCARAKTSRLVAKYRNDGGQRLCNACYGQLLSVFEVKRGAHPDDVRAAALSELLLDSASEATAREATRRAGLRLDTEALDARSARFVGTSQLIRERMADVVQGARSRACGPIDRSDAGRVWEVGYRLLSG